ncbi:MULTISPECIES: hypothetical protein [Halolamina]|uniref:DUF8151 domain-containing protein n=1 Tax=Halolamina pelagica TaxID=699431 RepID=A0A1I5QD53_9EURY|nr:MULTISPECIES: hypothetical protein [Halolamina]NHX35209.1 hypothetical protein [Halolamina sp. R1-12]SFP44163.1 hypothetical protein SAMN05216277_103370 [Halolamina pelagica]
MDSGITEIVLEVATLLAYTLLSSVLTYAGVVSEQTAIETFASGATGLAVWFLVLGAIALYGGVVAVGRDVVGARLLSLLH